MKEISWQSGNLTQNVLEYGNNQLIEDSVSKITSEEALENTDEFPWEQYIEHVTVRVQGIKNSTSSNLNSPQYQNAQVEVKMKYEKVKFAEAEKYICPHSDCGKLYVYEYDMKNHIRILHKGQEIKCDLCGKNFTKRGNMVTHTRNKVCFK